MTTMKAAVFYEHGGLDVLKLAADLPIPEPGRGQVRLRMHAAALNRLDLWVREGWKGLELKLPHITCSDGAGVVDALGEGVTSVAVGDRVGINPTIIPDDQLLAYGSEDDVPKIGILGEDAPGVAAEYVVLPARNLIRLPDHISFAQAAAAGLVYVTAWHSLITRGALKAGESVLIIGAGGGVNSASIQIAKHAGATVYVVGSNAEKCAQAAALGADYTINREEEESWAKALFKMTSRQGVDIVVDNVGAATLYDSIRSLRRNGRVLIVGNTSGPQVQIDTRFLFAKQVSLIGSSMGPTRDFRRVMELIFSGALKPVIGRELPLADVREAHRLLEEGSVFGKIVLNIAG
ncbi:zinc-binding dehydrogenase [Anaerolineae bacterium CFX9]|nr:zinc-binding dehydrogenase [Anaerolineae bacterium CFX9]